MAMIYYEQDADLNVLKGKTLAVIGYGNQGRNQALNLKDSGLKVVIGAHSEKTMAQAKADGFEAYTAKEAAAKADIIQILIQDDLQGALYKDDVLPSLKAGKALMFSHGFNIHFGQIVPPADVDVFMIAPKG
ncbi:MAG TPA: NAD(P)-binding domain-containing protein, partial [bacterium]|nr:NAD(P)-binding domain-containing protein [bacterium]